MTPRTYAHLSELDRPPTAYEIASTQLLYYVDRGFETAVPIAAWYRSHQAGSALASHQWEQFRDPRETTHATYAERRRAQQAFVDGEIAAGDDRDHVRRLPAAWREALAGVISPLRYPVHGLQMIAAYVAHMAPNSRIVIAGMFQAADETRRIERLAYRLRELQRVAPVGGSAALGDDGRARWERDAMWQPLRELIERLLVTYDWGEALVVLAGVVKPRFDALFTTQLAALAHRAGDDVLARVLGSLGEDADWHRAWTRALIEVALADRPANRAVIAGWIARWTPLATRAFASFAPALAPAGVVAAAAAARAAVEGWPAAAGIGARADHGAAR